MKFGEADVLARAKNTSVEKLAERGALYAQKGIVRLLTREEMPEKIDSEIIWLLMQQLTQAMKTGGVVACATIVMGIIGSNAERAKALAYRLFTIAERKGWADEAFAYNSLVISWQDIQSKATELQNKMNQPKEQELFLK
jgi:putative DNA methylase